MANENWPESRERLLQDIEAFSLKDPNEIAAVSAQEPGRMAAKPSAPVAAKPATLPAKPPATPQPAISEPATSSGPSSLLDTLKSQAKVKLEGEEQKSNRQAELVHRISSALEVAFQYLNDLSRQLNILKPPYEKVYPFFGVVDFDHMTWAEGRADYRIQQVSTEERFFEQVTLRYRLVADKQFKVTRENPAQEKLRKVLFDHNIAFTVEEERNDRSRVERATFTFPCEIKAGLLLVGDYDKGKLVLRTRNIERFGAMEFQLEPEAVNAAALDELTRLILGQSNRIAQLFPRTA